MDCSTRAPSNGRYPPGVYLSDQTYYRTAGSWPSTWGIRLPKSVGASASRRSTVSTSVMVADPRIWPAVFERCQIKPCCLHLGHQLEHIALGHDPHQLRPFEHQQTA